jgi:hypothetical protein
VLGLKNAVTAIVVALLEVWPERRCAVAVHRVELKSGTSGRMLIRQFNGKLEAELAAILSLFGDFLKIL